MLKIENLLVKISQITVEVSDLLVRRGEYMVLLGPSGVGKTLLLYSIVGIVRPVRGKILLDGKDITYEKPEKRNIALVPQNFALFPHMSIYENIALGPILHNMVRDKEELDQLVRWALEKAMLWDEVKDRLDEKPGILSGGQQQRLCIARALALKPKILLLDEPTANIDPDNTSKIEDVLRSLCRELTVVLVTHDHEQAKRLADVLIHMRMGRIVLPGKIPAV